MVPQTSPVWPAVVVVTVPIFTPLRKKSYPATRTLSVDGSQLRVRPVCATFTATRPVGFEGGVVSGQAVVATATVVFGDRLPAASYASIASV